MQDLHFLDRRSEPMKFETAPVSDVSGASFWCAKLGQVSGATFWYQSTGQRTCVMCHLPKRETEILLLMLL